MSDKPTYEELEKRVKKLEGKVVKLTQVEEALRESEIKHKTLVHNIPGMVYRGYTDWSAEIISGSKKVCGYTNEELNSKEEGWLSIIHPADKEKVFKEGSELAKMQKDAVQTYRIISKEGDIRWVEDRKTSLSSEEGEFKGIDGIVFDITARKHMEEALRKSEKRYRFLTENVKDVIWTRDMDLNLTYISPSVFEQIGFTVDEALARPLEEAWTTDSFKRSVEILKEELEIEKRKKKDKARSRTIEVEVKCKDGSTIWAEAKMSFLRNPNGEPTGIIGVTRDITKRKQAEESLRESEEKYRLLFENANESIFIIQDGMVKFPNSKTEEMTGYSEKELSEIPFINIIHPDDREMVLEKRRKRLLGEKLPSTYSFRMIDKSGQELLVQINAVLITWEGKSATLNFIRDITDQKRLEAQLQQAQKMESVGLLAGGVAHDLNNVLSGIVSYPELLLLDLPENSKLRKPIETMQESGHRASAIVQDLLTVARGVATTKEPLNLNDLVNDYLNSPEFEKLKQFHPTVRIKINLDSNLLNIAGSHVHIRKVIMNLVSNASEAIEGSGNVIISTMNRYIDRPLKGYDNVTIGEYAVLAVSDDGSGISSGDLERIFDPFYTKKVMGRSGTGLGLAVVWNVVQDHKGYIDVKSDDNGTIFELYFSITRDEISDKALSIPIKDYKGSGETILVVDDVESQREISSSMLDTLGYNTKTVSSGEEAVEYLKENVADLILLDMIMDPGINGRETYERIIKIHPNQKAIITSGFAETDDVKETQKLGAGRYIKKPLTLEKIGIAVRDELKK